MSDIREKKEVLLNGFSKLPSDIVLDIISRLPLKTISACKWVSKTWYALILNPRFAQIHFAKSIQANNSPSLLFRVWHNKFHLIDNECFDNFETSATAYHIEFNEFFNENFPACYEVVGTVNGLICFCPVDKDGYFSRSPYYICNPITKDYVIPPKSPTNHIEPIDSAFGFDSVNNEYKVVRILRAGSTNGNEVEVHTLGGSDSWRKVIAPRLHLTLPRYVIFRNCLHWVAMVESHSHRTYVILSFDLATEEFSIMQLPWSVFSGVLMVFRECLCLMDGLGRDRELWMMKDYGIEISWVKEFVLERENVSGVIQGGHEIIEGRNHKLLLFNDNLTLGYGHPLLVCKKYPQYGLRQPIKLNNGELLLVRSDNGYRGYDELMLVKDSRIIWGYKSYRKTFTPIKIRDQNKKPVVNIDLPIFFQGSLVSPKNVGYH